jgi:hypothetical protein
VHDFFFKKHPFTPVTNTQQKHDNHRTQVNRTELTRSFIINESVRIQLKTPIHTSNQYTTKTRQP